MSEPSSQFELYSKAVCADRYRVTVISMAESGPRRTFILDKKDGVSRGFTPAELLKHIPRMLSLQSRGENLYYTPLSEAKHHVLVDDMDLEKLERLIAQGYRPAVVLESSPANFQAIITVPKLDSCHDKDVSNRISEYLNREFGDPKLLGCIHPHRALGFQNRKPKHRRADGSYPYSRLVRAEARECGKTLDLARQINADYEQAALEKSQKVRQAIQLHDVARPTWAAAAAYRMHYEDVSQRQMGELDLSRVDSMIAVRMRVTGFDQPAIESAVRHCAPLIRANGASRNWDDYAHRTARYAFSPPADRQVAALARYKAHWERLEAAGLSRPRDSVVDMDDGSFLT